MHNTLFSLKEVAFRELGPPLYEQLSDAIEHAIRDGRLRPGDRLPPVRQLAEELAISVTTVTAAFGRLSEQKLIRAEVGRGTFVATVAVPDRREEATQPSLPIRRPPREPWRRHALMTLGARLRSRYPSALDCSTGRPDVSLLPGSILKRAWRHAIDDVTADDLQYAGPEPIASLVPPLIRLLEHTGITAHAGDLLIGSSAQQWMMLALEIATSFVETDGVTVAVEEPGYPTILDAYERAGARLLGVAVDE